MNRPLLLALTVTTFLLPHLIVNGDESVNPITRNLQGVWNITDGVNQGEDVPDKELDGTKMKIDNDVMVTYDADENEKYRAKFTLDATTKPFHVDITTETEGMPPMKALGILRFTAEDKMQLCYSLQGVPRPTECQSTKGSKTMLFTSEKED